jgi:hypothetical protein
MARHREGLGAGEAITAQPAVVSVVANSPQVRPQSATGLSIWTGPFVCLAGQW